MTTLVNKDNNKAHTTFLKDDRNLHVYDTPAIATSDYYLNKPLVLLKRTDGKLGVVYGGCKYWPIRDLLYVRTNLYSYHFTFKLSTIDLKEDVTIQREEISNVCIAIPTICPISNEKTYIIFDMEWREMNERFKFNYSTL